MEFIYGLMFLGVVPRILPDKKNKESDSVFSFICIMVMARDLRVQKSHWSTAVQRAAHALYSLQSGEVKQAQDGRRKAVSASFCA